MPKNKIDEINNQKGGIINIYNPKNTLKYSIIVITLILIGIILSQNNSPIIKGKNSPSVTTKSGDVVIDYSTQVYSKITKSYKIEFFDMLSIFSIPHDNKYVTSLGWDVGSDDNSKIEWLHSGMKENTYFPNIFGYYQREGNVSITNNGHASHSILKNNKVPATWSIKLMGPRMGVTSIFLSNNVVGDEGKLFIPHRLLNNTEKLIQQLSTHNISYTIHY